MIGESLDKISLEKGEGVVGGGFGRGKGKEILWNGGNIVCSHFPLWERAAKLERKIGR